MKDRPIHIKAVLFQLQGTVVQQGQLAEKKLKAGIGCPLDTPLFDYIQNLPKPAKRKQILSDLEDLELKAVTKLNPDAAFLKTIPYLISKNLRLGIMSTISAKASRHVLRSFRSIPSADIEVIISRDDFWQHAPETNLIDIAAEKMGVAVENLLIVSTPFDRIYKRF
jgi:beta-phosphoglucomutase-like phosphatase (HAD superfamily)